MSEESYKIDFAKKYLNKGLSECGALNRVDILLKDKKDNYFYILKVNI